VLLVLLAAAAGTAPAVADDLTGADTFLCASVQATLCTLDEECAIAMPAYWNIPAFIEVDLQRKELRTTKASGEARTTPIKHLERADGLIVLQGAEAGRAFSFVITEGTGEASVAVARDGVTVGVFGSCTPMPSGR